METRSNHVLVGAVVLILLALLAGFLVFLARVSGTEQKPYDIFFQDSVGGLARGSQVTFSGVGVGAVKEIVLDPNNPAFVRVRIEVDEDTPVLQGTTATIQNISFTAPPAIQLDGAVKGAPPISRLGPYGAPVIPTAPGAIGQLLSNAPQLLERLTTLTERLTELLSDRNQASLAGILDNTEQLTRAFADRGPEISATLAEAREAVRQAGIAIGEVGQLADSTDKLVQKNGDEISGELKLTIASARDTTDRLNKVIAGAQPGVDQFSKETVPQVNALVPQVNALVAELRATTANIQSITKKIDQNGASSLISSRALPDYEPKDRR